MRREGADTGSSDDEATETRRTPSRDERYRHTRFSAAWLAIGVAFLFGVALVDFIAQNTRDVRIEFFGFNGRWPIAVALLVASLAGALVVLLIGVGRVAQLRLTMRRHRRDERARRDVAQRPSPPASNDGPPSP